MYTISVLEQITESSRIQETPKTDLKCLKTKLRINRIITFTNSFGENRGQASKFRGSHRLASMASACLIPKVSVLK